MKKMLSVLTALALGSTTAATVVACGPEKKEEAKPDGLSWELEDYNKKPDSRPNQIWVQKSEVRNLEKPALTKQFWTGMFDADDIDHDHTRQWKRFDDQKVADHLDIVNADEIIQAIKDFHQKQLKLVKDEKPEHKFVVENVEINLDTDLKSTTNKSGVITDYILKQSKATINKVTINLID